MKRLFIFFLLLIFLLAGCSTSEPANIAATTLPVYEFTVRLCEGTGLSVSRLVSEPVSCLHDYSLNVRQVKAAEAAGHIVISGAGLEDFMEDILHNKSVIDASQGISILECEHEHSHDHDHGHHHETDSHIWLSPENAIAMARNICEGLSAAYPQFSQLFAHNLTALVQELSDLQAYGEETLSQLSTRDLITFHDGFSYFADTFDLHILEAVEEESGSEASAQELKHLIGIVQNHNLPAIFTEVNGSCSAADVIGRETGAAVYSLDMAMGGDSYFTAMYHNINTIKEAMG